MGYTLGDDVELDREVSQTLAAMALDRYEAARQRFNFDWSTRYVLATNAGNTYHPPARRFY